ncbi:hypothetical protein [Paenarthrobacter sp. NPDC090522]|uniref:hypothetical protein n=1 Tax=Paenarthrobacter sp. NPDC090522 TaxID=3364383 RepID=UPI00380F916C
MDDAPSTLDFLPAASTVRSERKLVVKDAVRVAFLVHNAGGWSSLPCAENTDISGPVSGDRLDEASATPMSFI